MKFLDNKKFLNDNDCRLFMVGNLTTEVIQLHIVDQTTCRDLPTFVCWVIRRS